MTRKRATAISVRTIQLVLIVSLVFCACTTVPVTGRRQLSLISSSEMNAMSFSQYKQVLSESQLSTDAGDLPVL